MKIGNKRIFLAVLAAMMLLSASGCGWMGGPKPEVINPQDEPFLYLGNVDEVKEQVDSLVMSLYRRSTDDPPLISAVFTEPKGYLIRFDEPKNIFVRFWDRLFKDDYRIGDYAAPDQETVKTFQFEKGIYPFSIHKGPDETASFSGCLLVLDADDTMALATFGHSPETKLFNRDMLNQAATGILSSYTISFDEKNVMHYWLGNRKNALETGPATVELNFSGNPGLAELVVDDEKKDDFIAVLGEESRYRYAGRARESDTLGAFLKKRYQMEKIESDLNKRKYPLEMVFSDGRRYQGYICNLESNVFTAFLSIPCVIPEDLFKKADQGTISKFSVFASGDKNEEIAQIMFGRAK